MSGSKMDFKRALRRELLSANRFLTTRGQVTIRDRLLWLLGDKKTLTMDELVSFMALSEATLKEPLFKLRQRQFVCEDGGIFSLSPKGQAAYELLKNKDEKDVFSCLSEAEKEELILLLHKLNACHSADSGPLKRRRI